MPSSCGSSNSTGFARVPLTDAMARKIERIYRLGEEFFVRSEAEKQCYSMQSFVEGYRELGPEYSQVPERPDLTESFSAWNRNRGRPEVEEAVGGLELHRALREMSDEWSLIVRGIFRAMADAWAPGSPELRCLQRHLCAAELLRAVAAQRGAAAGLA